jgi:hypothetical protein
MGFYLLFTTEIDDQLMEKWIDFVEIKFHLNESIKWYYMQLNSIHISVAYAIDPSMN